MNFITKDTIERWADTVFSKSDLPYLISRLVRATTPDSTKTDMPFGSSTYIGGWDGMVTCDEETAYVPKGISLWEMGTSKDPRTKAESDYIKRKANPLGYNPAECVFVFVTPRIWAKKDAWIKDKKTENYWKDVIVYDSISLEQWLDRAPAVSRWFAAHDGVGGYPFDGVMTPDEFWEEWSIGPNGITLSPNSIIAGREHEVDILLKTLKGEPTIKAIKASTKNEAIAFIIAAAKAFPDDETEYFFSKTLIVETEVNYRGIRQNSNHSLNLIPTFKDYSPLQAAVTNEHYVLVPLGADDDFNGEVITLPTIDRNGQVDALIESGVAREMAVKYSKESGRNITILKRLLGFNISKKAKWFEKEDIREIIPILLIGRWDEGRKGDIELIEKLSGQDYKDYLVTLNKWKLVEESPLIQIGTTWRLTSPLDLWTNLSAFLTLKDFENIKTCIQVAFDKDQQIIPSEESKMPSLFSNEQKKFSRWCREGLIQSLILIGKLDLATIPNLHRPQQWVDNVIYDLLFDCDGEMWISVNNELPLISEASPESFIKAVKHSLGKEKPEIMDMFIEEETFFDKKSNHTGLLWALEGLPWFPEYLNDSAMILLKLSRLDPGGSIMNRPLNSLVEIFKPWHYQTLATFDERMQTLKYITSKEKEAGWSLLIKLLPESHGYAQPTYQMRWRMFDKNTNITYPPQETVKSYSAILEMLFVVFDKSEAQFSELMEKAPDLFLADRTKLLDWAEVESNSIEQKEFTAWKTIRAILNHHRSYPRTDWSLPEAELQRFETIYNNLEPQNIVDKHLWLFNNFYPDFPEGFQEKKDNDAVEQYKSKQDKTEKVRVEAIKSIIKAEGLQKAISLRKIVTKPKILGTTLAKVVTDHKDFLLVSECLNDEKDIIEFIHGFFLQKYLDRGFDWIRNILLDLQSKDYSNKELANILIPLYQSSELWNFVSSLNGEIQTDYWINFTPTYLNITDEEKVMCVTKLVEHKRFMTAISIAYSFIDKMPTDLLSKVLIKAITNDSNEPFIPEKYKIANILKELYKREDTEQQEIVIIEWLYLNILRSYGTESFTKNLEKGLATDPSFFIELLKLVFRSDNAEEVEDKDLDEGILDKDKVARAKMSLRLLQNWKQIPGMRENKTIDQDVMTAWVNDARQLAEKEKRLKIADAFIGKLLAQYPDDLDLKAEREKIYQLIEELSSIELNSNYSSGLFNKLGVTVRSVFAGGGIERNRAAFFEELEKETRYLYPVVSDIFKSLKETYTDMGYREDESAKREELEY